MNIRIINKHDTEANWIKAVNFIPQQGELIVYDIDENYPYERLKIGDGTTVVSELPFINETETPKTYISDTEPEDWKAGDIWIDTSITEVLQAEEVEF